MVDNLRYFSPWEVNELFCGETTHDFSYSVLEKYVLPMHGYNKESRQYGDFLRLLGGMNVADRRQFFQFITGCPRLPQGGLKNLSPPLTVVKKLPFSPDENVDHILPSVMTCQNYIKLPEYTSF